MTSIHVKKVAHLVREVSGELHVFGGSGHVGEELLPVVAHTVGSHAWD